MLPAHSVLNKPKKKSTLNLSWAVLKGQSSSLVPGLLSSTLVQPTHSHTGTQIYLKPVKLPALKIAIREETERQEKERKIEENIAQ